MSEPALPPGEPRADEATGSASSEIAAASASADHLGQALEEARPSDPAGLTLEQVRMARALFGTAPAAAIGRFRVLDRLGAGGMGVVYSAFDPELDRSVALKLVRVREGDNAVALLEAKTLARLSHPNVVPVFDVGVEGGHVYIVMEFIRGPTLRQWARGRLRSEVVEAYRQAGAGLSAAHAAGVVHRDFKPDNAVVGPDGRVRVLDFGLAYAASGDQTDPRVGIAGTPRYMAPEQAAGLGVTPAADQYSFAVSLAEALAVDATGERGGATPGWLAAIIDRGRAADPPDRFSSMEALLADLGRDPARQRRRGFMLIGLVAASLIAVVGVRAAVVSDREVCEQGATRLATAWLGANPTALVARAAALQTDPGLKSRLEQSLRRFTASWIAADQDACHSSRQRSQPDDLLTRRVVCLERSRTSLRAFAQLLADAAQAPKAIDLAKAARALPDPDICNDAVVLAQEVRPPPPDQAAAVGSVRTEIDRARIELAAGRLERAGSLAETATREARRLEYKPLLVESLLVAGHARLLMSGGDHRRSAVTTLREAALLGIESGAVALAIEAWARQAWADATTGGAEAALRDVELATALAERPEATGFPRALLYNNLGGVELASNEGSVARAAKLFERAYREARGISGPGAVELTGIGLNLGITSKDPAQGDRLLRETEDRLGALLGPDHLKTMEARWYRAMMTRSFAGALVLLGPLCDGYARHGELPADAAACWSEIGFINIELGNVAASMAAYKKAVATRVPGAAADTMGNLALARGDFVEAARQFGGGLRGLRSRIGKPAWWDAYDSGTLELGLGRAQLAAGKLLAARRSLARAEAILAATVSSRPTARFDRRLGRARIELARVLAATGSRKAAGAMAASVGPWLREAGFPSAVVAEMDRLRTAKADQSRRSGARTFGSGRSPRPCQRAGGCIEMTRPSCRH